MVARVYPPAFELPDAAIGGAGEGPYTGADKAGWTRDG
jgi:hypothetical protein